MINIQPIEDYLKGVVASEMPSNKLEALKAQAVLSRGLAYHRVISRQKDSYDVTIFTSDQSYQGKTWETAQSIKSVQETEGEALYYHDSLIMPYYSSTCGGYTDNSMEVWDKNIRYTRRIQCILNGVDACSFSPHYQEWSNSIKLSELSEIAGFKITDITLSRSNSIGRVKNVSLSGRNMLFDNFKAMLAQKKGWAFLKSNIFYIEYSDNKHEALVFRGKGLGHGVGLCQYGSIKLAEIKSYREILKFYFPDTDLKFIMKDYRIYNEF